MPNITMAIDAGLLRRARKVAGTKETSVNAMVRDYLEEITRKKDSGVEDRIARLRASWDRSVVREWKKPLSREELYAR